MPCSLCMKFVLWIKSLTVTIQIKGNEQVFTVVLFVITNGLEILILRPNSHLEATV